MKLVEESTAENNIADNSQFTISASTQAFKVLSSSLYERKHEACLRELSANALDAQIEAGNADKPIKITLPTELSPTLIVQDIGVGMSKENIKALYTNYFSSSKSATNDLIGGFGLGSKSPFAVAKSFVVTSVKDHTLIKCMCYLDNGVPNISFLNEEKTFELNGTIVEVPCTEFYAWESAAEKLFMYWEVKPNFNLNIEIPYRDIQEPGTVKLETSSTYSNRQLRIVDIVVGNFSYKVTNNLSEEISSDLEIQNQLKILSTALDTNSLIDCTVFADIGEIELAPSRERIEETEDNAKYIKKAIQTSIIKHVDSVLVGITEVSKNVNRLTKKELTKERLYKVIQALLKQHSVSALKQIFKSKPVRALTRALTDGFNATYAVTAVDKWLRAIEHIVSVKDIDHTNEYDVHMAGLFSVTSYQSAVVSIIRVPNIKTIRFNSRRISPSEVNMMDLDKPIIAIQNLGADHWKKVIRKFTYGRHT